MNIKLSIAFDGTNYHGWQRQQNAITVEETLLSAISKLMPCDHLTGCSRTDAGVHANGFVVNLKTETRIPYDKIPIAVNTLLPNDIRVLNAEPVAESFHARFDAKSKTYYYRVFTRTVNDPFLCGYSYHFPYKLDCDKMTAAADIIKGKHDFRAFMATGSSHKTTVRTVNFLNITQTEHMLTISINADAFLYNMVRIITGTLLYTAIGKLSVDEVADLFVTLDRRAAGITVPPQGLFLDTVYY